MPWKEIACSRAVWAICIAHFCNNWGFYTLLTCLPLYLKDVLRFDITQVGHHCNLLLRSSFIHVFIGRFCIGFALSCHVGFNQLEWLHCWYIAGERLFNNYSNTENIQWHWWVNKFICIGLFSYLVFAFNCWLCWLALKWSMLNALLLHLQFVEMICCTIVKVERRLSNSVVDVKR